MFEERYISRTQIPNNWKSKLLGLRPGEHISLKNKDELKGIFNKYIDYHAGNSEGFPTVSSETVHVPMADKQKAIYGTMMRELPWLLRKKVEMGLAPDRRELDKLIPFLTGARMISNGTYGFEKDPNKAVSPKIQKAFEYLKSNMDQDKDYKALIYSNYLDSGVNPYKKMLDEAKIPYGEFSGSVKDSVRNQLVQDYNANKLRALIVSSAGGEGLDLKGTRLVQLLEPHFNNEKLKQVIGRAARYKSHEALSPEKRKVLVQRYLSEVSPTLLQKLMREKSTSTDEYLQNLADQKEQLNNKFLDIIKSGAALEKEGMTLSATKAILRKLRAAGVKVQRSNTIPGANYDNVNKAINIRAKDNIMNHMSKNTPVQDLWHEYGHFLDHNAVNEYYGANYLKHTNKEILRRPATILEFENRANTNALNEMRNLGVSQQLQNTYTNNVRRNFESYKPNVVWEGVGKKHLDNVGLNAPENFSMKNPAHMGVLKKMQEALAPISQANARHQMASIRAADHGNDPYRQIFKPIVRNLRKKNPEVARAFRQYHSEFKEPLSLPASGAAIKTAGMDTQIPLAIGGALAGLGSRNLLGHLYEKTVGPMMRKIAPLKGKNLREMVSGMGLKRKVQVNEPNLLHAAKGAIEEAGYNPNTGHIDFSSARMYRPGIAAHELGHAHIENNPGVMNYLQNNIYPISEKFSKYTTPILGAAAGLASNHNPVAGAMMGGLGGLLADSGRLLPEFEATRRGIMAMMKSSLPLKEKLKNSASLLPAYLTYLGQSAGSGAVAGGLAGI
jgi:hypothetical protein